jgi:Ni/Co efflux regulator RcnB
MGKTILSLLGSTLIAASTASAAMAAEHHARHHQPHVNESVQHAFGWYNPHAFNPADQNAFGTITPSEWTTGMQPDDWRQSVNGR